MLIYGLIGAAGLVLLAWLWRGDRDPLIYLVPASLAFPPILAYAGKALAWPTGRASTRVALAGCILLFGLFRLVRGEFGYLPIRGIRFLAPYLGLVALSVLWSVVGRYNGDVGAIANEFLSWLLPVAVFLLLAGSRRSNNDSGRAARVLLMTTLGIALFSFLQALALLGYEGAVPSAIADLTRFGQDDLWWGSFRLYGTLPNLGPNVMGVFLTIPVLICWARIAATKRVARAGWAVGGLAGAAVILATFSRGAMLALLIGALVIPVWCQSGRATAWVALSACLVVVALAETPVGRSAASVYKEGQLDRDATARVYLWKAIWRELPQYPLGRGFNGWLRASRTSLDVGLADQPAAIGSPHPAENQWMREVADRGVLGVVALAGLLVGLVTICARGAASARHESDRFFLIGAGAAFVGWAVAMLTGDELMYDTSAGMFWYVAGIAVSLVNTASDKRSGGVSLEAASTRFATS